MRNLIKIAAVAAAALLGGVTASQAQYRQQASTEAGVGNAQSHAAYRYGFGRGFGGAYAYAGPRWHHRWHHRYRRW